MASVWGPTQLPSGAWRIRWRAADGSQPSQTYPTRSDAMRALRDLEAKLGPTVRRRRGRVGPQPISLLTIDQVITRWRETREGSAKASRPGSDDYMDEVERKVRKLAGELGWATVADAKVVDIADLKRRRKNVGVNRPMGYLRAILRWAAENIDQPLDPKVDVALRVPQSRKAHHPLLTDRQAKAVLARARRFGQLPIFSCIAVYGWRPITATRLRVRHFDAKRQEIQIAIKQNGEPWVHPLFPFHVEMLRKLVDKRGADEPLFPSPRARKVDGRRVARAWTSARLSRFYDRHLGRGCESAGDVYALKRFAMTRMNVGAWPWSDRLEIADIQLFTGHKTKEQVLRYLTTNEERARRLIRGADRGAVGAPGRQAEPSAATSAEARRLVAPTTSNDRHPAPNGGTDS